MFFLFIIQMIITEIVKMISKLDKIRPKIDHCLTVKQKLYRVLFVLVLGGL